MSPTEDITATLLSLKTLPGRKEMIDLMAQFSAMMPDSVKQAAKKVKIKIKDVKEEGDKATVTYSTSDDPAEKKLNMVKQEGKWLVKYSKMDDTEPAADTEPVETNTVDSTIPPADGTKVDTSHH
jgi:hypothetical protein